MRRRPRVVLAVVIAATIAVGLATRRFPGAFGPFLAEHAGDALWAVVVWLCYACVAPAWSTGVVTLLAAVSAALVECSQLSDAGWLVWLRNLPGGRLVLGDGFVALDFVRYAAGIGLAAAVDLLVRRRAAGD